MTKFDTLLNILDVIISQAPSTYSKKYPKTPNADQLNQSRSRAFIHLFLMVKFGILDFKEREHFITDKGFDGGIDGYYINPDNKTVYFLQSKFRTNDKNFENKELVLKEILVMDINRILDGEESDELGNEYNGKIKQLQREIATTENIARYSYQVIILANLSNVSASDLRKLTGGFATSIFNFEKSYEELVFPVISGTYFQASDVNINIDLSNKNAGSKISYTVLTKKGECEITVLFVPTIELGKIMYKYKNSILKYNPRSYLGHEGKKVNDSITQTITQKDTNEFALFNNGITMLSDETYINERIGQKNKAQLIVKNPQIINGGQTSYTLSRIFEENKDNDVEKIFQNKEVLLKIITLLENKDDLNKIELINDISNATNMQTPVINADKISNDEVQLQLQKILFDRYGILYERKRGEFADGVYNGFISERKVLERNLFLRMYYSANGYVSKARQRKLFQNEKFSISEFTDPEKLDKAYYGSLILEKMIKAKIPNQRLEINAYARVKAMTCYRPSDISDYSNSVESNFEIFKDNWSKFLEFYKNKAENTKTKRKKKTGEDITYQSVNYSKWFDSENFDWDVKTFFEKHVN